MTKIQRSLIITGVGLGMNLSGRLALMGSHPLIGKHSPAGLSLFVVLWLLISGVLCFVGGVQGIVAGGGLRAIFNASKKRA